LNVKLTSLFTAVNISRQAFYKQRKKKGDREPKEQLLLDQIRMIRADHPRLSCRKIFRILTPDFLGRDRFEAFCFANGFKLYRKRAFHRTTDSRGVTRFANHVMNRELTGVNQVWVSDITYYRIADCFYYITLVMDQFSRRIVGHSVSRSMEADQTTIPALKIAIADRNPPAGMVIHSDGGGQYYANAFKDLTDTLTNSMGKTCYENPYAERLNGTIKNDYLIYYKPRTFEELLSQLNRAVNNYNQSRPHTNLSEMSPVEFEKMQIPHLGLKPKKRSENKKVSPAIM
jgi:putative transposase